MKTLNGWQRLWVLVICIYFFIVSVGSWVTMPEKSPILEQWVYAILDVITKDNPKMKYAQREIRDRMIERGTNDEEFIENVKSKIHTIFNQYASELKDIYSTYQGKLDNLYKEQLKHIGISFLSWVIPSCLLYIIGLAVGWIYRGFKDQRSSDYKPKQKQDKMIERQESTTRIDFNCPKCQFKYSALAEQAGKVGTCKNCETKIIVPKSQSTYFNQEFKQNLKTTKELNRSGTSINSPYFSYMGRLPRSRFWYYPVAGLMFIPLMATGSEILQTFAVVIYVLSPFTAFILSFPIVKRLHDLNLSGWLWWIMIIPLINLIFLFILILMKGTKGENKYGPNPLQQAVRP